MSGFIEVIKPWAALIVIIVALGIVGQMDYEDACRADKHCKVDK